MELAAGSREKYQKGYGLWLSFLASMGWLEPKVHPASRITRAPFDMARSVFGPKK